MTRWDCSEEELLPLFARGRIHSIDGRVIAKPAAEAKQNKYSAVKTDVNGELCDSKKLAIMSSFFGYNAPARLKR